MMFDELYNSLYFDWMVEIIRDDTTSYRISDILDGLFRHGAQMTDTQITNILNRSRKQLHEMEQGG